MHQHAIHVQHRDWVVEFVACCSTVAYETYSMVFDAMVVAAVRPLAKAVAKLLQLVVAKKITEWT